LDGQLDVLTQLLEGAAHVVYLFEYSFELIYTLFYATGWSYLEPACAYDASFGSAFVSFVCCFPETNTMTPRPAAILSFAYRGRLMFGYALVACLERTLEHAPLIAPAVW